MAAQPTHTRNPFARIGRERRTRRSARTQHGADGHRKSTDAELRTLALLRGVRAIRMTHPSDSRDFVRVAERILRGARLLTTRDRVVVATGFAGHGTERLWLRQVGAKVV